MVGLLVKLAATPARRQAGPSWRSWPSAGAIKTTAAGIWNSRTRTRMYGDRAAGRAIFTATD
jgi:hypothetical protein